MSNVGDSTFYMHLDTHMSKIQDNNMVYFVCDVTSFNSLLVLSTYICDMSLQIYIHINAQAVGHVIFEKVQTYVTT